MTDEILTAIENKKMYKKIMKQTKKNQSFKYYLTKKRVK